MLGDILHYKMYNSPVGKMQLIVSSKGLCGVYSGEFIRMANSELIEDNNHTLLQKAEKQLIEYFAGKRKNFDLKLDMRGTIFQISAWQELQKIPYGETISYGEQALRVGDKKKSRAVGAANGRNPLLIIVPCHRVIGKSGALTGFSSGIEMKQVLLDLEKAA